jgi:hypothetical protein
MVPYAHLWLPIVLSAVLVFVVSSLVHMVFKYHNSDYGKLANEDEVRAAINRGTPGPGQYILPYVLGASQLRDPVVAQKFTEGPNGMLLLRRAGLPNMGSSLGQWFVYLLVISALVALVACHTISPGAGHHYAFHVIGLVSFLAYGGSQAQVAIWRGQPWKATLKDIFDSLLYALVTAETFVLLWPPRM